CDLPGASSADRGDARHLSGEYAAWREPPSQRTPPHTRHYLPRRAMTDLFANEPAPRGTEPLEEGAGILRGFASDKAPVLLEEVGRVAAASPFRHLVVPGGHTMSVAMTNCGRVGWVSDRTGYRYDPIDPDTGVAWPVMPAAFLDLAVRAAAEA